MNKKINKSLAMLLIAVLSLGLMIPAYAAPVDEIRNILTQRFVEDVRPLISGERSIERIFEKIDDPYTNYFNPQEAERFFERIDNSFVGIGVYFQMTEEGVLVTGLIEGGPAERAGILEDDVIIRADQYWMAGLSADQAVNIISGPENTRIPLRIKRGAELIDLTLTRQRVTVPYVISEMLTTDTGYLRLTTFGSEAGMMLQKEITKLKAQGAENWVFDLRDNTGGFLFGALDVLGLFLPPDKKIYSVNFNKRTRYSYSVAPHQMMAEGSIMILQNRNSASASEITTAALQGYRNALVIGEQSFGKGSLQAFYPLSDGGTLRVTEERFLKPDGSQIDQEGIGPDLAVPGTMALEAAELLSGNPQNGSPIQIRTQEYYVNIELASDPDYFEAYLALVDALDTVTAHRLIAAVAEFNSQR